MSRRLAVFLLLALAGTACAALPGTGIEPSAAALSPATSGLDSQNPPATASPQNTAQAAPPKVIKNPIEYETYMTALNLSDATARADAMNAFATKYPDSVVRVDALEQALAVYEQGRNKQKIEAVARQLIEANPGNLRTLAVLTSLVRSYATQGDASKVDEVCSFAQRGTSALPSWHPASELSESESAKLRTQVAETFYGASGFCDLQRKLYRSARENYLKALQINTSDLVNNWQLATADLESYPIDIEGFWYAARAIRLAQEQKNAEAERGMALYSKAKYTRYHGGEDGWEQVLSSIGNETSPPTGFAGLVKKAPSPAELACKAVQENDPATLSLSDWEFVLERRDESACNLDAADKVWAVIQKLQKNGQEKLTLEAKVISTTRDTLAVAVTEDRQTSGEIDLEVTMAKSMVSPPARGTMIKVSGFITRYNPRPFFFEMQKGEIAPAGRGQGANHP